jgi:hypothetical protein
LPEVRGPGEPGLAVGAMVGEYGSYRRVSARRAAWAAWWQSLTCLVRYATRTVLSGEVSELIEHAKTNLRELAVE